MSVPLSPTSARRIHAARFAAEFRKALESRDISLKAVERATGISHTNLWTFKAGNNLPRLETAVRLAETLHWPQLVEIAKRGRAANCARKRCGRTFVNEGGSPKRYCSEDCRDLAAITDRADYQPGGRELLAAVRSELDRVHGTTAPVSRRTLKAAADHYARSGSKRGVRITTLETVLERHRAACAAFCGSCEPDGYCKTPECELRSVSPLPLQNDLRDVASAVRAPGRWGGPNREPQIAAFREQLQERWSDPEKRQALSERTRARWAATTPEERAEAGQKISQARRRVSA